MDTTGKNTVLNYGRKRKNKRKFDLDYIWKMLLTLAVIGGMLTIGAIIFQWHGFPVEAVGFICVGVILTFLASEENN
ncbi:MAG: hypothetical protein LBK58_07420 [Prevotellaceae bacterium]|jgi:hypothetical protein|nr:hypothetical protein [Prevotellaceae bacterium]